MCGRIDTLSHAGRLFPNLVPRPACATTFSCSDRRSRNFGIVVCAPSEQTRMVDVGLGTASHRASRSNPLVGTEFCAGRRQSPRPLFWPLSPPVLRRSIHDHVAFLCGHFLLCRSCCAFANKNAAGLWRDRLGSTRTQRHALAACPQAAGSTVLRVYSPPTVSPSSRSVGAATAPRNSKSLPISEMLTSMSFKFPATVISSTG
jgi:hypothetical protein